MSKTVVLFAGGDALGDVELWETNGTAAGTVEITRGFEAGTGGLNPSFITAYGGEALFDGVNATGSFGLWATNGTASGTHQITGIKGSNPGGLHPMYMHSFNGEVLFRGLAGVLGDDVPGLWVTKGTAASTVEIGGAANAGIHNVFAASCPATRTSPTSTVLCISPAKTPREIWVSGEPIARRAARSNSIRSRARSRSARPAATSSPAT